MGKRICVYCSSSNTMAPEYYAAAAQFARLAAKEGHCLVCGGSWRGLMGTLIEATLEAGGQIEGIIPQFMCERGWEDKRLNRLIVVGDMQERKRLLIQDADAVVVLPGGLGTLEEFTEALSTKRLGQFPRPIILFNQNGFYDSLLAFFDTMEAESMLSQGGCAAWQVVSTAEAILPAIENAPLWHNTHK
jgi:TIGR00730 family protein